MKEKAFGVIIILAALFWRWYYGHMVIEHFYYKNQPIIFCFRPPVQVSMIHTILGIIGVLIGIKTYQKRLNFRTTTIGVLSLLIAGFLFQIYGSIIF